MASGPSLSEPFQFSKFLFTGDDGLPIKFSMRPCEERSRLRPVIEHGGGMLTSKSSANAIRLADPGSRVLSENCYSTRFVWDSAVANKLLNMQDYKSRCNQVLEGSDVSEAESVVHRTVRVSKRQKGRKEYSIGDDQAILDFISGTRRHAEIKGTALWKDMEQKKVLSRTWQSMKERFLKQVLPSIASYNLSVEEIRRFRMPFSNEKDGYISEDNFSTDDDLNNHHMSSSVSEDDNSRRVRKYTVKEDLAIVRFIIEDRDNFSKLTGNTIWKHMALLKVVPHSWQSMKERFHKRILPNIGSYNAFQKPSKRLLQLIAYFPATARAQKNAESIREAGITDAESPSSSSGNSGPISTVNPQEVLSLSDAEKQQGVEDDADSESGGSHNSRKLQRHKRLRLPSSSDDSDSGNPPPKRSIVDNDSENLRNKYITAKEQSALMEKPASDVSSHTSQQALPKGKIVASESESTHSSQELSEGLSPQVVIVKPVMASSHSDSPVDLPTDVLRTPTNEAYNPRLHALARRKLKAQEATNVAKDADVGYETELYVSDTEADGDYLDTVHTKGLPQGSARNISSEEEQRLINELHTMLGLKRPNMNELFAGDNCCLHSVVSLFLDEWNSQEYA